MTQKVYYLVLIIFIIAPAVCFAEPNDSGDAETKVTQSGKVIEFKQLTLQGTVQRPSAAYLMQRRKIKFKGLVPKKSFICEIGAGFTGVLPK